MNGIEVILENCVGCKLCVKSCPYDAIEIIDNKAVINEKCTLCGACVEACKKYNAIKITRVTFKGQNINEFSGICIFAENRNGKLASVVPEIIGAARELKKSLDKPISAILLGNNVKPLADEIISYGVDEVLVIDSPAIGDYAEDVQTELVTEILKKAKPEIFLGGGTVLGRSLLPRVAVKLLTGLTADCTELSIDSETKLLKQTRPAFGGNIMATILTENHRPQMATVRHKVMKEADKVEGYAGKITEMTDIPIPEPKLEFLEFVEEQMDTVNLADADIIVSAGRGIRDPKNLEIIHDLAKAVNGAVGASRAVVDADWITYSHQVGQTGKTVNPTVYIACGISGAIQHLAGMKGSDIIVAINSDPDAPIFDVANYGIVGDLFQVLQELMKQVK